MKKLLFTAVAGLTLVGPFATLAATAAPGDYQGQQGQYQHQTDNDRDRNTDRDQYQEQNNQNQDREARKHDRRYDRGGRQAWRENDHNRRWDQGQHNGYYQNNRWHYGPPPAAQYGRAGFALGYHPWSRGQRLGYYTTRYSEIDYRSQNLRRPPRGYHWVRDDRGDYLLAAVVSGLIAQVIINSGR